jgi:hypothetical protein
MISIDELRARILSLDGAALEMTDDEVDGLDMAALPELLQEFGAHVLLRLPPREAGFMQWLRREDPGVYDDLWGEGELLVSLYYLSALREQMRGFAICELERRDNYYFTHRHVKPEALKALPAVLHRARQGEELSIGEVLMFEILQGPIDIWHFCYRYAVPLSRAKAVVAELVSHNWLAHVTDREDLAKYIDD